MLSGATLALRAWRMTIRPCASSRRSASRIGMWLTPSCAARSRMENCSPALKAPVSTARRISEVTRSTAELFAAATDRTWPSSAMRISSRSLAP